MTKEEAKAYLDNYRKMYADLAPERFLEALDIMLNEPSLPSVLDEAAERIVMSLVPTLGQKYEDGSYVQGTRDYFSRGELIGLVKAGAEWMAGQCYYIIPVEIDNSRTDGRTILSGNFFHFNTGDRVIVQIRKK